jgi:hypothetical protein
MYPQHCHQHQTVRGVAQQDESPEVVIRTAGNRVDLPGDERRKCQEEARKCQHVLHAPVFVA